MIELDAMISEWSSTMTADELLDHLIDNAVPCGRVYTAKDMLDDPQFVARETIVNVPHEKFGEFPMQNIFPKFSETPGTIKWAGADLGAHNDDVYRGILGFDDERMADYRARGII